MPVPVELDVEDRRWPAAIESTAYFVACEGLTNAVKHAHPTRAWVRVHCERDELVVSVRDDGTPTAGLGGRDALRGIRERLETTGGRVEIESSATGTTVRAHIPCS